MKKIKNIIFDMDGTLVDTEMIYLKNLERLVQYMGNDIPEEDLTRLAGKNLPEKLIILKDRFGWHQSEAELESAYRVLQKEQPKPDYSQTLFEGVPKVLAYLRARGIRRYIASNSMLPHVTMILSDCGILDAFDGIMTRDIAGERKPDPKMYHMLLTEIPLDSTETLAVEDSDTGIAAAVGAGIPVLAIRDPRFHFTLSGAVGEVSRIEQLIDYLEEHYYV